MQRRAPEPIDDAYMALLRALALDAGLDHVGVAPATVMHRARAALIDRKRAGLNDSMQFTYRDPQRSTDPGRAVAGAQAMLVAARHYAADPPPRPAGPVGSIARYAWVDHYAQLRRGLQVVARRLKADGYRAVVFADDNSVVDREAAHRAGLGWFGKNANLLVPGAGSFVVLGSVVTTAPLLVTDTVAADGCGACERCLSACPTGAIVAPGVIDAGRCLSWVLQRPGIMPRELRAAVGDRLYGCDDCQTACPPSVRFVRVHGEPTPSDAQAWAPLIEMLDADDEELLRRFDRFYIADRDPTWLRRNAIVALGNVGSDTADVRRVLVAALRDPRPMIRAHAVWAAAQLGLTTLLPERDADADVTAELAAAGRDHGAMSTR